MAETINVVMLGDTIGDPGLKEIYLKLGDLKRKENIDLAVANGENAQDGFGVTESNLISFKNSGIDVITTGNHIWSNPEAYDILPKFDYLIRPANYPNALGKGYWIGTIKEKVIGIANVIGRYNMVPVDCPFQWMNKLLKNELKKCDIIIVDFHGEHIPEKLSFSYEFDGKVSLIVGSHTHVQTADERIMPKGTGYITDMGMCGGIDSVIGMNKENVLNKLVNQTNSPFIPSEENPRIQGIIAKIDKESKKTKEIKRVNF